MNEINFDKYKGFWVLTSFEKVEDGLYLAAPPVRIIPHHDREQLKSVLLDLFAEDVPLVPRPDFDDPGRQPGIKPEAFGLKSPRVYFKHARAFYLQRSEESLSIEEWTKEKWSWVADPAWREEFSPNQLDELIDHLIERTKSED